MKRLLWLALMGFGVGCMEAGRPQPLELPQAELNETWAQYKRMKSMAGCYDVKAAIRDIYIAEYIKDIDGRLEQLEQHAKQGDLSLAEVTGLKELVHMYKPKNHGDVELRLCIADPQIPGVPGDDDAPSFLDDEKDDDLAVHVGQQDQEDDDVIDFD